MNDKIVIMGIGNWLMSDDGVGVPDEVSESGLRNARRRAVDLGGSLEISRVGTRGTVLIWRVPLRND